MRWAARSLFLFLVLIAGQVQAILVEGIVRDAFTGLPLNEVRVAVENEDGPVAERTTLLDGFYRFELMAGHRYVLRFERHAYVSRSVLYDASEVPRAWAEDIGSSVDVRMFPPLEGLDSALVHTPVALATWNAEELEMVWDMDHSAPLLARRNTLLAEHLKKHPEMRPSVMERCVLWMFDHMEYWLWLFFLVVLWTFHKAINVVLRHRGRWERRYVLMVVLAASAISCAYWPTPGSPLRAACLSVLFIGLYALARTVIEFLFDPTAEVLEDDDDEEDADNEGADAEPTPEMIAAEAAEKAREEDQARRAVRQNSWSGLLFVGSVMIFVFEFNNIRNTLDAWSLVRSWGGGALLLAAAISWLTRRPSFQDRRSRLWFASGTWWVVLPLLTIAGASFINRRFPAGDEQCANWPIDRVTAGSNFISVIWAGGSKELALPKEEDAERMVACDSLRCCYRVGALGHAHVFRIAPVAILEKPR